MKNIVIVNQSSGYLIKDIANAYALECDKVVILGNISEEFKKELKENISLLPLSQYNKSTTFSRLSSWFRATIKIIFTLSFKFKAYNVLYVTNPPMSYMASLFNFKPYSILIYDLYPDALKSIGISEKNPISKLWGCFNKFIFKRSKNIYTIGQGMKGAISKYVSSDKIKVIHLWPAISYDKINYVENSFIKEHGLKNNFVVLYSGNIGQTHSVETLAYVAETLPKEYGFVKFVIIGEGMKKKYIMSLVEEKGIQDKFLFLPYQPLEMLPYSLGSANIGVVTLDETTAQVSVPSKTFNLLSLGIPILSIAPKNSEIAMLTEKYGFGKCQNKDQVKEITDFIIQCINDKELLKSMGEKSIKASKDFNVLNAHLFVEYEK